jgi:hypothetical protein
VTPPDPPDLFAAAGLVLEAPPAPPKPKRRRKRTSAEIAAAVRLEGARRDRSRSVLMTRERVGPPRDLRRPKVLTYPLSRNAALLQDTLKQLPHLYADEWDKQRARVARNLEQKLFRRGIPKDEAQACAMELLHAAFRIRADEAHKEMGIR